MKPLALSPLIALALAGCTTPRVVTSVTRISTTTYPTRPADCDIQVLTQMPTGVQVTELAILNAVTDTGSFTKKDLDVILPSLKARACELGADAIVIKNVDQGGSPMYNDVGSQTPTKVYCVAIKVGAAR